MHNIINIGTATTGSNIPPNGSKNRDRNNNVNAKINTDNTTIMRGASASGFHDTSRSTASITNASTGTTSSTRSNSSISDGSKNNNNNGEDPHPLPYGAVVTVGGTGGGLDSAAVDFGNRSPTLPPTRTRTRTTTLPPVTDESTAATTTSPTASGGVSTSTSTSISELDRLKLLQRYLPQILVDAYFQSLIGQDDIPHDELIEALQTSPQLVLEESCPERYFRMLCNGAETSTDPGVGRDVAMRLANYWKARKTLFMDKAYQPLLLPSCPLRRGAGAGPTSGSAGRRGTKAKKTRKSKSPSVSAAVADVALSEEDMKIFETGIFTLLPETVDPVKGRSVIAHDRGRLPLGEMENHKSKMRVAFYLLHLIASNPVSQRDGMVLIGLPLAPNANPSFYHSSWGLSVIRDSFPISRVEFHGLFLPSRITTFQSLSSLGSTIVRVAGWVLGMYSQHKSSAHAKLHIGVTDNDVLRKLIEDTGFNRADIPTWMAGEESDFDMDRFYQWLNKRYRKESKKRKSVEAEVRRRRTMNAKQSQAKRDKERAKITALQQKAHALEAANTSLRDNNEKLEEILRYAQEEADVMEGLRVDDDDNEALQLLDTLFDDDENSLGNETVDFDDDDDDDDDGKSSSISSNTSSRILEEEQDDDDVDDDERSVGDLVAEGFVSA